MDMFDVTVKNNIITLQSNDKYEVVTVDQLTIGYKSRYINIRTNQLDNYSFIQSSIIKCIIDGVIIEDLNYINILEYIYDQLNDGAIIIQTPSNLKFKIGKYELNNYKFIPKLDISYQIDNDNIILNEIAKQSIVHDIKMDIMIKLVDGRLINIII